MFSIREGIRLLNREGAYKAEKVEFLALFCHLGKPLRHYGTPYATKIQGIMRFFTLFQNLKLSFEASSCEFDKCGKRKKNIFFLVQKNFWSSVGTGRETPLFVAFPESFQNRVSGAKMIKIHSVTAYREP